MMRATALVSCALALVLAAAQDPISEHAQVRMPPNGPSLEASVILQIHMSPIEAASGPQAGCTTLRAVRPEHEAFVF